MRKLDWVRIVMLSLGVSVGISALVNAQPQNPPLLSYDVSLARIESRLGDYERRQNETNDKIDKLYYVVLAILGVNGVQLKGQLGKRQQRET